MTQSVSLRAALALVASLAAPFANAEVADLKFTSATVVPALAGWFDVAVVSGSGKLVSINAWTPCGDCMMMFSLMVDGKAIETSFMGAWMGNGGRLPNDPLQQVGDAGSSKFHYALPEAIRYNSEVRVKMRVHSFVTFPNSAGARIVTAAP